MALGLLVSKILHFCWRFFLHGQGSLVQIIISIFLRYCWCWFSIFNETIISSEDSIPQCDFELPEICDVIEKCMGYGQDTLLLHCTQKFGIQISIQ